MSASTEILTTRQIFEKLHQTKHGKILDRRVRWGDFRPPSIDKQTWVGILGSDAHNYNHQWLMRNLARVFMRHNEGAKSSSNGFVSFSPEEEDQVDLASPVHDFSEAKHYDKPAPKKTKRDDRMEAKTLSRMLRKYLPDTLDKKQRSQIYQILTNQETKLGDAWRCIEILGYMRACLLAYQRLLTLDDKKDKVIASLSDEQLQDLKKSLSAIVFEVIPYCLPTILEKYLHRYPAVEYFMDVWEPIFSHLFEHFSMEDGRQGYHDILEKKRTQTAETTEAVFLRAKETWQTESKIFVAQQ